MHGYLCYLSSLADKKTAQKIKRSKWAQFNKIGLYTFTVLSVVFMCAFIYTIATAKNKFIPFDSLAAYCAYYFIISFIGFAVFAVLNMND